MTKIAIFASGFGSNFEALAEAVKENRLQAEIALLVTDKPHCYAVERAKNHQIEVHAFDPKAYSSKEEFETEIVNILQEKGIELIVLAGYMRLIGKVLLNAFSGKIINIHPSLLPAFPGLHAIEKAYEYGVKVFGITIHYVDEGMDTGRIITQTCFHTDGTETVEEIEARIHQLEHKHYPETIQQLIDNK